MKSAPIRATVVAALAASLALWAAPAGSRKQPPPPCPDARYLLADPVASALAVGAASVAIDGVCDPIAPKRLKRSAKGTRLKVLWPSCAGLDGKVKLTGTITGACDAFRGTLKARRFKRSLRGDRSRCGDGIVDGGSAEACEPPDSVACDTSCRARSSGTIGGPGGTLVSDDGLLTLAVPAGALPGDTTLTIRRLDPVEAAAAGGSAGYDLGPEGVQFLAPVTATLGLAGAPVAADGSIGTERGILFTTDAAGANAELPAEQETLLDGVENAVSLSVALTHFSKLIFRPERPEDPMAAFTRVTIVPGQVLPPTQPFTPNLEFQSAAEFVNLQTVVHTDETEPGDRVVYAGPQEVELGKIGGGITRVAAPVAGYACGEREGLGEYRARVFIRSAGFLGFGAQTSLVTRIRVLIECKNPPRTTTTNTSTTSTSTSSRPTPTVSTTTVTSTSSSSSTSSTSTSSSTTTSTSSTTSTTLPSPGNCCDCAPPLGCASGPVISPTLCATTCNGMAGTLVANAECSLETGNCVPVGRAVVLATPHASLPAGFRLCLDRVSSAPDGCTSVGPECTAGVQQLEHLHRTIAVQGFAGTFADPNPTGCGHGVVVENERGCLPDTVPACQ